MKKHLLAGITLLPAAAVAIILGYLNWSYLWTFGVWFICYPVYILFHPTLWLAVIPFPGLLLLVSNFSNFWPLILFSIIAGSVFVRLIWYGPTILYAFATDTSENYLRLVKTFFWSLIWIVVSYLMVAGTHFTIIKSIEGLREQGYKIWTIMIPSSVQATDAQEALTTDQINHSQKDFIDVTDYADIFTALVSLQQLQDKQIDFNNNTEVRHYVGELESLLEMINTSVQEKENNLRKLESTIENLVTSSSLDAFEKGILEKQLELIKLHRTYNIALLMFTKSFKAVVVFTDQVGINNELPQERKEEAKVLMTDLTDASHKELATRTELNKKLLEYNQLLKSDRSKP